MYPSSSSSLAQRLNLLLRPLLRKTNGLLLDVLDVGTKSLHDSSAPKLRKLPSVSCIEYITCPPPADKPPSKLSEGKPGLNTM